MTTIQIKEVRRSWAIFKQIDPLLVADVFYSRLFAIKPSVRRLFPADMHDQYRKLIQMMTHVVAHLDRTDEIATEIRAMAKRHIQYGVKPADYALVGSALMWTLEKGLGNDWSDQLREAWLACYKILADTMVSAVAGTD